MSDVTDSAEAAKALVRMLTGLAFAIVFVITVFSIERVLMEQVKSSAALELKRLTLGNHCAVLKHAKKSRRNRK